MDTHHDHRWRDTRRDLPASDWTPRREGFQDFLNRLATLDQGAGLQLPANGNPFPINAAGQTGNTGPASGGAGAPLPAVASAGGFGGAVSLLVVLILIVIGLIALNAMGILQF